MSLSNLVRNHSWIAKALAQSIICNLGLLPLYHLGQRKLGRLKSFHPSSRTEYAAKLYSDVADFCPIQGSTIVEIGSGWVPVVPLTLHLMGAKGIITYDLNKHLQPELTLAMIPKLRDCLFDIQRRTAIDISPIQERLDKLVNIKTIDKLFYATNIDYKAPADVSESGLAKHSVDILYSNLVLEHIPVSALKAIHSEAIRIVKPDGICWHNIDYSDHYAATYKDISGINFLQYSERFWESVGNNDILYQNRLRKSEHIQIMRNLGFDIIRCVDHQSPDARRALDDGFRLHSSLNNTAEEDLLIASSRIVLRKATLAKADHNY